VAYSRFLKKAEIRRTGGQMKKRDELKELRAKSKEEVLEKIKGSELELMKLRFRHAQGQLKQTAQLSSLRRSIARAKTVLSSM